MIPFFGMCHALSLFTSGSKNFFKFRNTPVSGLINVSDPILLSSSRFDSG